MTTVVDKTQIEAIVGARRHPSVHVARGHAGQVYILHPTACVDQHTDLRDCPYSHALDRGIRMPEASMWQRRWDRPVVVTLQKGRLIPHLAATAPVMPPVTLHDPCNCPHCVCYQAPDIEGICADCATHDHES